MTHHAKTSNNTVFLDTQVLATYVGKSGVFAKDGFTEKMARTRDETQEDTMNEHAIQSFMQKTSMASTTLQSWLSERSLL